MRDDRLAPSEADLTRGASRRGGSRAHREDFGAVIPETGAAAHERAVMTVRLTLLLVIVGVALFLFTGPGGLLPVEPGRGRPGALQE